MPEFHPSSRRNDRCSASRCAPRARCSLRPRQLRADDAEDKAVALVKALCGEVTRDEKALGKPVVKVSLRDRQVTGTDLRALAPLTNLTELNLSGTPIADADLGEITPFVGLTKLDLSKTPVTVEGLPALAALRNVRVLNLSWTRVTGAGLKNFGEFQNPTSLDLSRTCAADCRPPDVDRVQTAHRA